MNIENIINTIRSINGVTGVSRWTKGGHDRLYITLTKHNGGSRWNGGEGCRGLYIDLTTMTVREGTWAGARTEDLHEDTMEAIAEALVVPEPEVEVETFIVEMGDMEYVVEAADEVTAILSCYRDAGYGADCLWIEDGELVASDEWTADFGELSATATRVAS